MTIDPRDDDPTDDEDLIAYLDGELDEVESRAVESRLADDDESRAKADEYQKTYDLLDYLPKPTPSPTFTTRTLTALQPILAPTASGTQPIPALHRRVWPELLGWAVAAVFAVGGGFLVHRLISPPVEKPEPASADDYKLMGKLPLYVGVDDLDFVRELDKSDLFDPAELLGSTAGNGGERSVLPQLSDDDRDRLYTQFRTFTPARQQQLRTLHQQLSDPTLSDRDQLIRTLETYAVWLDRLSPSDRKRILEATPAQRLEQVQSVHMKLWRESLPEAKRRSLKEAVGEERAELVSIYREGERSRRREWELAQRQWKELSGKDKVPWPFNDAGLSQEIDKYIKTAFGVDPNKLPMPERDKKWELPPECRLSREELLELRLRREATADGYWLTYGSLLLRLSEAHPTYPRPTNGKPIVRPADLPTGYPVIRENPPRFRQVIGKWPDFALEVSKVNRPDPKLDPLGPCRPEEFTDPVKQFVLTKLTDADRKRLEPVLGRWPEYPKRLTELAREKNLSVPEVMLPGEPKKWQEFYQLPSGRK